MVLKMLLAGSSGGRAAIITSSSSIGLLPPSSAPHRIPVQCALVQDAGCEKLHQSVLQLRVGVLGVSARVRIPLFLSNTWCGMCRSTVLYITLCLTT